MIDCFETSKQEIRLKWIRKNGWIVQTIVSSIGLIIAIVALISKF